MPLYGHELNLNIDPYQAGLGRVVNLNREEDFVGKAALAELSTIEANPVLVGLTGSGKRAARADYKIYQGDAEVGIITSGALSPTLGYPVAMGYLAKSEAEIGNTVEVDIRGTRLAMSVVKLPFYKRSK
jgi:aminomethyltransferase